MNFITIYLLPSIITLSTYTLIKDIKDYITSPLHGPEPKQRNNKDILSYVLNLLINHLKTIY